MLRCGESEPSVRYPGWCGLVNWNTEIGEAVAEEEIREPFVGY